ncbi:MAG: hypothetical protein P8Z38_08150 [Robiginitalea sp.]|jgi:hypothetical protein
MKTAEPKCCNTRISASKKGTGANGSMSLLSTILLILIPKCPLCLTAYMSAMVLFFDIDNEHLVPILLHAKPVLAGLILLMILMNFRGRRTFVSLGISITAMVFLLLKTYYATALLPDWVLYTAFFFAIWYNGNFQYFYRFIRFRLQKKSIAGRPS